MVRSNFRLRIDFEDRPIVKAKGKKLEDFDNLIKGLKDKFNGGGKK